ncbi:Pentatricopeptide repeat [Trema orientale]|uniref:Pentatricopeptide repeat n=1 Tax=Trema orientale TaxID=63057 RepID=A0A2P5AAH2_TREOI|nr:Pentatricopeptide repeat [Trema orientale]
MSLNFCGCVRRFDISLGDIKPARQIFDSLRDRDVVAWTALIVGYVRNGLNDDVLELFRLMIKEGPKPNNYTFAAILSVSSTTERRYCDISLPQHMV